MEKMKQFLKTVDLKAVPMTTYVYAIVLILTMINYVLGLCGYKMLPTDENLIMRLVVAFIGVFCIIQTWWQNNSITKPAQVADTVLNALKDGKLTIEEVEQFVEQFEEKE